MLKRGWLRLAVGLSISWLLVVFGIAAYSFLRLYHTFHGWEPVDGWDRQDRLLATCHASPGRPFECSLDWMGIALLGGVPIMAGWIVLMVGVWLWRWIAAGFARRP